MAKADKARSSARTTRRTTETRTKDEEERAAQKAQFLEVFAEDMTITGACKAVGIGRQTFYDWKKDDGEFRAAFEDVDHAITEALEKEAYERATVGVEEPMVSAGKLVTHVTKKSDTLLIFLLKARRPQRYRDNVKVEHTGADGGPIRTEDVTVEAVPSDERRGQILQLAAETVARATEDAA